MSSGMLGLLTAEPRQELPIYYLFNNLVNVIIFIVVQLSLQPNVRTFPSYIVINRNILSSLVAGPTLETFVGANINTILITNLLSGMDYNVKIFASQASGFSDALTGVVKTRKTNVWSLQASHVVLLRCVPCNSTPASTWLLLFFSLALPFLDGWCFMERKVCS